MPDWQTISQQVHATTGISLAPETARSVGGGCINAAYLLQGSLAGDTQPFFVKTNTAAGLAMFEAEAEGLQALADSHSLQVPMPMAYGLAGREAYLMMEYLPLKSTGDEAQLGIGLATMHQTLAEQFGWQRDNTIGSTPQHNPWTADWISFWAEHRLGFQLEQAGRNGADRAVLRRGETLRHALPAFFTAYQPVPSLLHGDLWSGNYAFDAQGQPVIFDPAVYFGDRETDLAMTELFGGFSSTFYAAYQSAWPLDTGYATRKTLYNLYHILNHFNLFGGGYLSQANGMIERLLSECR